VRLIEKSHADPRFEVELPLTAARERTPPAAGSPGVTDFRGMTALVIEPDETAQKQLMGLLAAKGYRVVPVANADTGLELAQRIKIDAAFCSMHAPGLNWVELAERMQPRVGGFILLSDGYDSELASNFEGYARYVLAKPVQEADLDRVLRDLEPSLPMIRHGAA
jgi:CheY-like chemotaxis protein